VEQLTSIARIGRELGGVRSIDDLLRVIHQETIRAVGADCGSFLLTDTGGAVTDPRQLLSVGCPLAPSSRPWSAVSNTGSRCPSRISRVIPDPRRRMPVCARR
jgi:hypothetical protein